MSAANASAVSRGSSGLRDRLRRWIGVTIESRTRDPPRFDAKHRRRIAFARAAAPRR